MGTPAASRRIGALVVLAVGLAAGCARSRPTNVLLIVVDTLRADHLGLYGYERPTSPHLDDRARSAVVFERVFSTSSWTVPAMASMLSGLPPAAHGGGFEVEGAEYLWDRTAVDEGVVTLAERLRRRGLSTVAFLSNPFLEPRFGLARGFDDYQLYEQEEGADWAVDRALDWMARRGDQPFFMLLHFLEPHAPYRAPEPYLGLFTGEMGHRRVGPLVERRARAGEYGESDRRFFAGRYDEEIVALDARLERLFSGLGERWEDTLVIFTSDHGEELLDHGSFDHGHTMMQELLHVPLMIWAPGLEARRVDSAVSLVDVTPTILDALGLSTGGLETPESGRSLWGVAHGDEVATNRSLLAEGRLFGSDRQALIRWPYKLVFDPETDTRRLVDLEADPGESRNLAPELPELADEMEEMLRASLTRAGRQRGGGAGEVNGEIAGVFQTLGYVN